MPLVPGAAGIPLVDPHGILYVGMYRYHGSAQVMVLDKGYQSCIYVGYEGELQRVLLTATDGHGVLLYAYIQCCSSDRGGAYGGVAAHVS